MRAVSATTSAENDGPDGGMISDDTRGAIQPIISTGMRYLLAVPRAARRGQNEVNSRSMNDGSGGGACGAAPGVAGGAAVATVGTASKPPLAKRNPP